MSKTDLAAFVDAAAAEHGVPGAGIGVLRDGVVELAFSGVTSLENPLPVDPATLFQIGSISKTYAATAVMRLVADGLVDLAGPVRRYVPELRLKDESVAATVTVLQLLNHTAGWDGSLSSEAGDGDGALARFVERMPNLAQLSVPGEQASYNNAAIALAGRLIEKVTGQPYESAIRTLLLDPLGMTSSYFTNEDVMTRRFTVGHNARTDGTLAVAAPWRWPQAGNPEGGLVSTLSDQLAWARFHLGDGCAPDGRRLLPAAQLAAMQSPTVTLAANAMGDAVGIGWFLREIDGAATVGHMGSTNGQRSELRLVPGHDFAMVVCSNAEPNSMQFNQAAVRWALATYLDIHDQDPDPLPFDRQRADEVQGTYESSLSRVEVKAADNQLILEYSVTPEAAAEMGGDLPEFEPCELGLLPGDRDEFMVLDGPAQGMRGSFARDASGRLVGIDFGGRMHGRATGRG